MGCRPLDIKLISAKDLKDVNVFSKMDVYAIVSISNDQTFKTPVDKDCGRNPKWNFPMKFTLPEASLQSYSLTLTIKIKTEKTLGSSKDIGIVQVSCKELFDQMEKVEKVITYAVRTPSGKSKGSLEFSYRFGETYTVEAPAAAAQKGLRNGNEQPVTAYPAPVGYPGPQPSNSAAYGYPGAPPPGQYPYPASSVPGGYPAPGGPSGYPYPPPPQQPCYGYKPQYGAAPGYGHHPAPSPGYGGYPMGAPVPPKKSRKSGLGAAGLGLGLAGGLLGGLLVGDMISEAAEAVYDAGANAVLDGAGMASDAAGAAYDAGVDAGLDGAGFDF